ncbi:helix-turn-helix transcriptional regulator [Enterococcus saccharolyticus]|uniref:helix-turn-helix domain-containing protein n=1 Tax=Enterococcus TaxID=1350 RepID=UPI001379D64F|nr:MULTISPECIES: helix-turn-helix transcriptional regulator [Enterococcus]MCD5003109.1 helix-turn-helix transcriptional regulator [Enterococcus saccharolyticus]
MKIGKIIKEERLKRELTQEEFAQEFFVTRQLVSKWENSKSYPDLDQVVQMSEWFGLSLDYLLKEDTKMVDELNFDGKLKKRMTYALWGIIGVIISIIFAVFIVWWFMEPPILQAKDIDITQVEKIYLPEKQIQKLERLGRYHPMSNIKFILKPLNHL